MNIKSCIFDLDGVVVDTAKYHYLAWKQLANSMGFDFTPSDNERLKGISRMASLDILLEIGGINLSSDEKIKAAEQKNELYRKYILAMTPDEVLPGVCEFLKALHQNNIRISLGSASKNAQTILNQLGIRSLFDAVADGTNVSKAKPDPEVFLTAAQLLNTPTTECLVFEDAVAGVEAAHRAGMKCVGVGNPDILNNADHHINDFTDYNLILKWMSIGN